jgi:phosphatidylserine/phosphatidylglycerophosphate/cardiolipin synthase-like enzyme
MKSQRRAVLRRAGRPLLVAALTLALSSCTDVVVPTPTPPPATTPSSSPASSPTPSSTSPAPSAPTQRLVFGDPWSADQQRVHAVAESELEIVDQTPGGQTVTLSAFNMTYPTAADTLIRAHQRGVAVHVLLNSGNADSRQATKLQRALGSDTSARSWVVVRTRAVRMHSKFLLSSASGGQADVVWVSSGNLTSADGDRQINEALITTGDRELYDFLAQQFTLMRKGVTDPGKLARTLTTPTATVQTYPLPTGGPNNDPVQALLDDVTCRHGKERTVIRMAHLDLHASRLHLAKRLRQLKADGCVVRLVGNQHGWSARVRALLTARGRGQIDLRSLHGITTHTKLSIIEGWDASGQPLEVAMVGTHNLTRRSLTVTSHGVNDEVSLFIHNPELVARYGAWVDDLFGAHGAPVS